MPRDFEELAPNEVSVSGERTITADDVESFAALTGDTNEIHLSDEAARAGPFGRPVAQGAFIFAVSLGLIWGDPARRPRVLAFLEVERLRFLRPVFLGDAVRVRQTVRSLDPVSPQVGRLEVTVDILNQDDAVAVSYTAKLLVQRSSVAR